MASSLNEESVEKKLKTVNNTQDSIQSLSLWIIHHKSHHAKIVELWMKVLKKSVHPSHRLTLLYLCNDVVQTCKKKKAFVYNAAFKEYLREAASLVRDNSIKGKVERIFNIWGERGVYDAAFIKSLHGILNGKSVKSKRGHKKNVEEVPNAPISPAPTPKPEPEVKADVSQATESLAERDAEESARILAEFKPHEMIDQITAFKRQEAEIHLRVSQLSHLKLDASSIEAVKQLKDRAHGNDFSSQFEDSCMKLEDLVKRQSQHLEDQNAMLETLRLSETFYEEQYREAKIVANAYKNFGARINNMKKKLDEVKRSMPQPDSPIPSPDMNAPSPGSTPPHIASSSYGYNPASSVNYRQGLQPNAWMYNGTGSMDSASAMNSSAQDINSFPDSPPLEAPSPEGSPPDLNLDGSDNVSGSLESRLASFFDRGRSDSSNPPVYTPQLPRSMANSGRLKLCDEDGSATPLDDETPTTPVQDEHLSSPPKRSTPPKKENPIDFLSRLISQTQKAPVKSGAASFLDSLTMLTSGSKKPPEVENQQQSSNPQSWAAWKAKSNECSSSPNQPSSPSSYGPPSSLPTSPTQFPPTPTMVPPPIPMPVPPPVPLSMGLNVPPPPPPPFALTSTLPPPFSAPLPVFQQTSPGQKENWPDIKRNLSSEPASASRAPHSSVLKELVPADGMEAQGSHSLKESTSLIDPDAMEIVSDEEDDSELESNSNVGEAKAEFAQKLKQKTSQGLLKSHVFVPNPERPNLMTLTVPDDLDEEDMIDDNTVVEETPSWSTKSHKSSHKSRSRSHSREKDRSHKHKKKKKHKRNHSDDEDSRHAEVVGDDGKGMSGLGSVVKKIDGHSSRNSRDSNKGDRYDDRRFDKYEDDRKYDRYDERKYDRYDDRGYGGRGDYKSHKSHRGPKDVKDNVEAYTQAYRDAFFQQYSQARFNPLPGGPAPMDQRRSSYGKY